MYVNFRFSAKVPLLRVEIRIGKLHKKSMHNCRLTKHTFSTECEEEKLHKLGLCILTIVAETYKQG